MQARAPHGAGPSGSTSGLLSLPAACVYFFWGVHVGCLRSGSCLFSSALLSGMVEFALGYLAFELAFKVGNNKS